MSRPRAEKPNRSVSFMIYVDELHKQEFIDLRTEIRDLWWKKYHASLTYRDIIIKACACFRDKLLSNDVTNIDEVVKINEIKKDRLSKYERINF